VFNLTCSALFVQGGLIEISLKKKLEDSEEKVGPGVVFGAA
jgi:hypothetical protein